MRAPKTLTVIMAATYDAVMNAVHLNESVGVQKRTVQIELTDEQRQKLPLGHEEVIACWFEPEETA
jgi:hypothetical protein